MDLPLTKTGRPSKRRVTRALSLAKEATEAISGMESEISHMNDRQKALFEAMMTGEDDLKVSIRSDCTHFFTGVARVVKKKDGSSMSTKEVTLSNVDELDEDSYARLLRLCQSQIRNILATDDYRKYTEPIREYARKFLPLALGSIVHIAKEGKEENQLKAANDLFEIAGERKSESKETLTPLQINIMLTNELGEHTIFESSDTGIRPRSESDISE